MLHYGFAGFKENGEILHHFQHDYEAEDRKVTITGLEDHEPVSEHKASARK